MVFIRVTTSVGLLLIGSAVVAGLGIIAYNEGHTNGERQGQLFTAQYVAQKCHEGGKLIMFGKTYYCGRIEML